jgi:fengycin family lipopeptide synthetase D
MTVAEILNLAFKKNVKIKLAGDSLKVQISEGDIPQDILQLIKDNKSKIIDFLSFKTSNFEDEIKSVEKKEYYKASSAQENFFLHDQIYHDNESSDICEIIHINGEISREELERAINKLVSKHEIFRTSFFLYNNELFQKTHDNVTIDLRCFNSENEDDAKKICKSKLVKFNLGKVPLINILLIRLRTKKSIIMFQTHHIILDIVSRDLFRNQLISFIENKNSLKQEIHYKDFTEWQHKFFESDEFKKQEEYWKDKFKDMPVPLELPCDFNRPENLSLKGNTATSLIDSNLQKEIDKFLLENNLTLFNFMLAVMNVLFYRNTGQKDITIGVPFANRNSVKLNSVIGLVMDILLIRNKLDGAMSFDDFCKNTKKETYESFQNSLYPYNLMIKNFYSGNGLNRNPFYDIALVVQNITKDPKLGNTSFELDGLERLFSSIDLTLYVIEGDDCILLTFEYSSELFKESSILMFAKHMKKIIKHVLNNNSTRLLDIDLLDKNEKAQLLHEFNETKTDYPKEKTIHELFEEQVEKNPHQIAIVRKDLYLSYNDLNERSNQIANLLINEGIGIGSIVGLKLGRSVNLLASILGVLKTGATCLPINIDWPKERISLILEDASCSVVLYEKELDGISKTDYNLLDISNEKFYKGCTKNYDIQITSSHSAYVIYTSGTTGMPKGVLVKHSGITNFINSFSNQFIGGFSKENKILSLTNYVFDVSICEFFVSLTKGATLVINDKHKTFYVTEIVDLIVDNCITFTYIPPTLLTPVYKELQGVQYKIGLNKLLVGVDSIKGEVLHDYYLLNKNIEIVNGYGPTESTICSTFYKISGSEEKDRYVTIGKPLKNTSIYILDKNFSLVSMGAKGEIFIGGDGISNGYLNRQEFTQEKFILNPFKEGERLYRTGDMARWLRDGNIEYLGRIDNQIKIRGYRIELGEIESCLLGYEEISECVVTAIVKEGDKFLCGYIVPEADFDRIGLRDYLGQHLPGYMIPSYFIELDKLPLNSNGKVDRKALPDPEIKAGEDYVAPSNEIEQKLVEIWSEVLNIAQEEISVEANFFDIGGHSLNAMYVIARIQNIFNVKILFHHFFSDPILKSLALVISIMNEDEKLTEYEEMEF